MTTMLTSNPVQMDKEGKTSEPQVPEEYICKICNELMTDAIMVHCCTTSFCSDCIRKVLLSSGDQKCPHCHKEEISQETLIPNRFLRKQINKFKSQLPSLIPKSSKNDDIIPNKIGENKEIPAPTTVTTTTTMSKGESLAQQHEIKTVKSTGVEDANNIIPNSYYESTYYPDFYGQKQNYGHLSSSNTDLRPKSASSFSSVSHQHPTGLFPLNQPPPTLYYPYTNTGYETASVVNGKYAEPPSSYPQTEKEYAKSGETEARKYSYTPTTTIADPLKEFEKFIREKDKEKEKQNHQHHEYNPQYQHNSGNNERREPPPSSSVSSPYSYPRPSMNYHYSSAPARPPPPHYFHHPYRPPPNFRYPNYRYRRPYPHLNPHYYPSQFQSQFRGYKYHHMNYRKPTSEEPSIVFRDRFLLNGGDPRQMFERTSTFPHFQSYAKAISSRSTHSGYKSCTSNLVPVPQQEYAQYEIKQEKKDDEEEEEKPLVEPYSPTKYMLTAPPPPSSIPQSQEKEAAQPQYIKYSPPPIQYSPSGNKDIKLEKMSKSHTLKVEEVERVIREKSYSKESKRKSRESSVSSSKSHKKSKSKDKDKDKDGKKERKVNKKSHRKKKDKKEKLKRKGKKKEKKKKSKSNNEEEEDEYSSDSDSKSTVDEYEDEGKTTETGSEIDSPCKEDHNLSTTINSNENDMKNSTPLSSDVTMKDEVKNSDGADENNTTTIPKTEFEEVVNIQTQNENQVDTNKSNFSPNPCDSTVSPDRVLQKDNTNTN